MWNSYWALGLFAGFACRAAAWNHISEPQLQDALDASGYTLIAFVMPSQTESQSLEPEWLSMQHDQQDANIVSFDCSTHLAKCKDLDVHSFPTIRVYHRDGRMDRYRGPRTARQITLFLFRVLRPAILELGIDLMPSMKTMDDIVLLGHLHPQDWELYDRFSELGRAYRDRYSFVVLPPAEGARRSVVTCVNNLVGDEVETVMLDEVGALEAFVQKCAELKGPKGLADSETGNINDVVEAEELTKETVDGILDRGAPLKVEVGNMEAEGGGRRHEEL